MNCCNHDCNQGRNCPAGTIKPELAGGNFWPIEEPTLSWGDIAIFIALMVTSFATGAALMATFLWVFDWMTT